jgi:two-component system phosphate regulon sensor histidine kinase PhoR
MRLQWRIFFSFFACMVLALAVTLWYANRSLRDFYEKEVAADLTVKARILARELEPHFRGLPSNDIARHSKEFGRLTQARVTVILPDGKVIGDSDGDPATMDNHADRPEIAEALKGRTAGSVRFSDTIQRTLMYLAIPVERDGTVVGVVRASTPLSVIDWFVRNVRQQAVMGVLLAAGLFALVSFYVARRISRPLDNMRLTAERLASGDLHARAEVSPGPEAGTLARTLNLMAARLAERMETTARQADQQEAVFSSMVEGVLAVGADGRILDLNPAAARLLDAAQDDARGRSIQETVRNPDLQKFVSATIAGEGVTESEVVLYGNETRHLQLRGAALTSAAGRRIGALVVLNDITRIKRLETVRQDFVANVSHELKTPITALRGCVETLSERRRWTAEDEERFMAMMGRQIERLGAIVEDLLSLSRIEHDAQHKRISLEPGPIRDVLRRAGQAFIKAADAKSITVAVECPDDLSAPINSALLEQAVGNLIDNAVKYSPERTRVAVIGIMQGNAVEISVTDQGPGIEKRHLPRVFERFYRVDQARSRALGGTGLGLAIVKHIVLAHGGHVSVESTPGQGSRFTIRIPRQ